MKKAKSKKRRKTPGRPQRTDVQVMDKVIDDVFRETRECIDFCTYSNQRILFIAKSDTELSSPLVADNGKLMADIVKYMKRRHCKITMEPAEMGRRLVAGLCDRLEEFGFKVRHDHDGGSFIMMKRMDLL